MALAEKLAVTLRPYPPESRYLIGVSGGRDSLALLHGLVAAGFRRLVVCHLEHGLRGDASRGDARFVARLAAKLALPFVTERTDVTDLARQRKLSLETAAREARYRFFARTAARRRCRTLFLAHHADDQVETFLFNLLRGAGPAGLAAMRPETRRAVDGRELTVVRPLLAVWRAEIDEFLHGNKLRWREDRTNADPAHATRNRLRLEVLPLLAETMGREVKPALWRTADLLGAEEAWLSALTTAENPCTVQLSLPALAGQPLAQQRRTLQAWLRAAGVPGVGYHEVEAVRALLDKGSGPAKVNLPAGFHARRRSGVLFLEDSTGANRQASAAVSRRSE